MSLTWKRHGTWAKDRVAETFPAGHLHWAVGVGEGHRALEVVADMIAARAAGEEGCGLGTPDRLGTRRSRSGWCGMSVGAPVPVAVVTSAERLPEWQRAIRAALLHRGATGMHPIALAASRPNVGVARALSQAEIKLYEVEGLLGQPPGLVVIDATDVFHMTLEVIAHKTFLKGAAFLIAADDAPAARLTEGSAVLETSGHHVILARSATGETWLREFSLERVILADGEAYVIQPGDLFECEGTLATNVEPIPAPPPKIVVPEPEPSTRWAVMPVTRRLASDEAAPWEAYDRIVTDETAAVPSSEQSEIEGLRLIEIVASDQDGRQQEAQRRVQNVLHLARTRGVEHAVRVVISTRTVRRWAA